MAEAPQHRIIISFSEVETGFDKVPLRGGVSIINNGNNNDNNNNNTISALLY